MMNKCGKKKKKKKKKKITSTPSDVEMYTDQATIRSVELPKTFYWRKSSTACRKKDFYSMLQTHRETYRACTCN